MSGCRVGITLALLVAGSAHANEMEDARHLFSEFSCNACHEASTDILLRPQRGPVLDGIGKRIKPAWIRRFLLDPQAVKPGTTMPNMVSSLPEDERAETVENLVHFLMSGGGSEPKSRKFSDATGGAKLFRYSGCAACHGEFIPDLNEKYTYGSLSALIAHPLPVRPDGRMPSLQMSIDESADIAGYLLGLSADAPKLERIRFKPDPRRVAAGKKAFDQLNCSACHTRAKTSAPRMAKTRLSELKRLPNCAGPPDFTFTAEQRRAMSGAPSAIAPLTAETRVAGTMRALNCYACHSRDGVGGPDEATKPYFTGDEILGNEGCFPPHLTNVGAKLRKAWFAKVLDGKGAVRPYLNTRMPVFGTENVSHLPDLFAKADMADASPPKTPGDLAAGHQLIGSNGGMACITCHGWGKNEGVAMRALSLSGTTDRLHFAWFKANLIDPLKMRPGTLMPSFWPGGKSSNPNVLGGDTDKQIAALWEFLEKGKKIPEGFPDPGSGKFEIVPNERPIIQRGFIEGGGTHAIAVGFPAGVHFIYDAKTCAPKLVWRGRFLDGYKLWFSRREPTAEPLSDDRHEIDAPFPEGAGLDEKLKFKGYRIDPKTGVPTFLAEGSKTTVEDILAPSADGRSITRNITIIRWKETDPPVPEPKRTLTIDYQW